MSDMREKSAGFLKKNSGTLLAAAVALLTALALFAGGVRADVGEDALRVSAFLAAPISVRYDDIRAARLVEDFDAGQRLSGLRGARVLAGRYLNDDLGGYALYAYDGAPVCIDLSTGEGHVVVSLSNEEKTRALYEALLDKLPDIP